MPANTKLQPSIRLMAQVEPEGQADAVMAVRWCVSPALAAVLKEREVTNPFLLISIRPYTSQGSGFRRYATETKRYLVPLTRELQYVSFSRPGPNAVTVCVVWNPEGKGEWTLNTVFLERGRDGFLESVFEEYSGALISGSHTRQIGRMKFKGSILEGVTDELTVEVPSEMFAKEYPAWMKSYIGKFFKSKAFDQCRMRGRAIVATLLSPLFWIGGYTLRVLQLILGVFLNLRDMHVRSFRHPIQYGIFDVLEDVDRSAWFLDEHDDLQPPWRLPLNPVTPTILAFILFAVGAIPVHKTGEAKITHHWVDWGLLKCLEVAVLLHLAAFALVITVAVVLGIGSLIVGNSLSTKLKTKVKDGTRRWWKKHQTASSKSKQARREADKKAAIALLERSLEQMVCNGSSRASVDALPKPKQTIRLRAQAGKKRVCKPFAR